MKKNSFIKSLLFVLLMPLLWVSAIQQQGQLWTFKPLEGVFVPTEKPDLSLKTFSNGTYQAQMEPYLKENIGFREPLIRFYNQYLFDFFKASSNENIVVGKDHWLYFIQHVNEYYGTEAYRWYDSAEEAYGNFDREARLMWKLRHILKDYGVEFFVFMAPQKGFVYPEHLPKRRFAPIPISAREYYSSLFDSYGFPYIEMTQWFIDLKEADTLPYSLFPQTGAHWGFSAALATDSLIRFMGELKGIDLPKLHFGPLRESSEETLSTDYDIENLANLIRPIPHPYDRLLDAEITFSTDSTTVLPSAIFVGTSFLMRMYHFVPFSEIFPHSQYWYYNSTVFYGDHYKQATFVNRLDVLTELLDTDYVVWFTEGDQMCKASFGFVEKALLKLCFSDESVEKKRWQLVDSLNVSYAQANDLILNDPERYFPELAGDGIPVARSPRIPVVLAAKEIKKDQDWVVKLRCQATCQNLPFEQVLETEAKNLVDHQPLIRDSAVTISLDAYVESFMDETVKRMNDNPEMVTMIQEKAANNHMTFDEQLDADARWIIRYKINTGSIYWNDNLSVD